MIKPCSLTTFVNDSLNLTVNVQTDKVNLLDLGYTQAILTISGLSPNENFDGRISTISLYFSVAANIINVLGNLPFSITLYGRDLQTTLARGFITVLDPRSN